MLRLGLTSGGGLPSLTEPYFSHSPVCLACTSERSDSSGLVRHTTTSRRGQRAELSHYPGAVIKMRFVDLATDMSHVGFVAPRWMTQVRTLQKLPIAT